MTTFIRLHGLLMAAAVLVPGLLFGVAVWQNHDDVLREGQDTIQRTAAVMQEHARKVFETAELAIGQVDERTEGQDWSTIAAPATSDFLHRLKAPMDQLVSIWVADRDGVMRAGSQPWSAGTGIAARPFFAAQQRADQGTIVSEPFTGTATTTSSFAIIRRRTTTDGHFDGTIHAAVSPAYFEHFYAQIAPPVRHAALLIRADGIPLAQERSDQGVPLRQPLPNPALKDLVAAAPSPGTLQYVTQGGVLRDYAFRKVGNYPVYVYFSVRHSVLLERWWHNMVMYGTVTVLASLTLLGVSWLALRGARAEQAALVLLRRESRQRQAVEQQLAHAQRMEAVGQLTGGVAHDFNNLLTAILGNLELVQRVATGPELASTGAPAQRIERLAATAIKAVQRGAALTKSLLAFSRNQPLQPRALDANALLSEFLELVRQAVGTTIDVQFEPGTDDDTEHGAGDLPPCIADPAALEAAILNLSINARDATDGHGWLRFRTGVARLSSVELTGNEESKPGRFVWIEVADRGCGMPPDVADKAFEPFFTTKPIGQGTGLGLSQVYGFTRQLGGHVTLASKPGEGTAITLFLPVSPPPTAA